METSLPKKFTKSLSFKQARAAVTTGFVLGIGFGALQIAADLRSEIDQTDKTFKQSLRAFEQTAFQAAYGLDKELAQTVVNGLFQQPAVVEAKIIDSYNDTMYSKSRPHLKNSFSWLAEGIFGETRSFSTRLTDKQTGFHAGDLSISVDTNVIAQAFFQRSGLILSFGILRNVILAIILTVLFHNMLTRPLRKLAGLIHDGAQELPVSASHKNDELGAIAYEYNQLSHGRSEAIARLLEEEVRYRRLFENSEVSLSNADYSSVFKTLSQLREDGVTDLRQYLDNNENATWDIFTTINILSANLATLRIFNASSEADLLEHSNKTFNPLTLEMFKDQLCAIWAKHSTFRAETTFKTLDGVEIVGVISLPLPETEDGFRSIPVSILDITEFKKAETELTFRGEIIEGMSEGVQASRISDGIIIYTNAMHDTMFGYEEGELIGEFVGTTSAETDKTPEQTTAHIHGEIEANGSWVGEIRSIKKDGTVFWCEVSATKFEHPLHGSLSIAVQSDVTEKKITEEKLRQSQRLEAVGQLTGGVAHDFNNLLAVIMGNQELLRDEITDPENLKFIDASIGATRRGADLTKSMLAFARRSQLAPESTDLNALVLDTKNWIHRALPEYIDFVTVLESNLWAVEIDRSAAESAVLNLIVNARDAMPDGGELSIATANVTIDETSKPYQADELKAGRYVTVAVSDSGHGISQEIIAKIFEPFFTTKPIGSGSGLGLSMIQGFMRQSRGTVRVTTELGVGTTFTLYFDAGSGTPVRPKKELELAAIATTTGARILVVEDQQDVLDIIKLILKRAGYIVSSANSGDAAKALFDDGPEFDLLITDLVMPGETQGAELARYVSKVCPDLPVVIMSGYVGNDAPQDNQSQQLGPQSFQLTKPIRRNELLSVIEAALQHSA
ncbi:PAS domain S-box protein [Parasedimentitalea maritima]|uniref:histidine kinase n=1 Tax=Parasedimentitalea maritima TaxID=2578117 RepID=A0A6A4RH20_9RHOB|nr:PAS domain S-box protein [Zongyanglinia marina]